MKTIAFDLDDTLCTRTSEEGAVEKYHTCQPINPMIDIVNELYEEGHQIIIYTARGMTSFQGDVKRINQELRSLTIKQLKEWGINFHKLIMGKAHYDLLVDDKVINSLRVTSINDIKEIIK